MRLRLCYPGPQQVLTAVGYHDKRPIFPDYIDKDVAVSYWSCPNTCIALQYVLCARALAADNVQPEISMSSPCLRCIFTVVHHGSGPTSLLPSAIANVCMAQDQRSARPLGVWRLPNTTLTALASFCEFAGAGQCVHGAGCGKAPDLCGGADSHRRQAGGGAGRHRAATGGVAIRDGQGSQSRNAASDVAAARGLLSWA